MKTFKFKTNIGSSTSVDRVASYLDNTANVVCWYVDDDRMLTVEGNEPLERRDIIDIVNLAGFSARSLKNGVLTKIFGA